VRSSSPSKLAAMSSSISSSRRNSSWINSSGEKRFAMQSSMEILALYALLP